MSKLTLKTKESYHIEGYIIFYNVMLIKLPSPRSREDPNQKGHLFFTFGLHCPQLFQLALVS